MLTLLTIIKTNFVNTIISRYVMIVMNDDLRLQYGRNYWVYIYFYLKMVQNFTVLFQYQNS